jgi:type II secretory pathway pseudopilin PulG
MTNRKPAFTVVELVVALFISSILVSATTATYSLFRRSLIIDQSRVNLSQNARIVIDRLSRELRLTQDVVTTVPANVSDLSVSQPGQIEFQDGAANDLTYRRYYISGSTVELDIKEYLYPSGTSGAPTGRVLWNAPAISGKTPVANVISTQDIADNAQSFVFYGGDFLQLYFTTTDGLQSFTARTTILGRNTSIGKNP